MEEIKEIVSYFPSITEYERLLPFFVATIGTCPHQINVNRSFGIDDHLLLYCTKGEGRVFIHGEYKKITAGMGFHIPPKTRHLYIPEISPWETKWITFGGSGVERVINNSAEYYRITHLAVLEACFESIISIPRDQSWSDTSTVRLYAFLIELKKCISVDSNSSVYDLQKRLKPITDYMKQHLSETLGLENLAEHAGTSNSYFCRIFKSAYNERPFEYINRLRLQKSKELLLTIPEMCITQIANAVGFHDASYYIASFKKQEKMTPSQFRKLHFTINSITDHNLYE